MLSEDDSGGSILYDAACHLRELLRGRAALLVVDRTDIVDAAEADGVLLSPRGAGCALTPPCKAVECIVDQVMDAQASWLAHDMRSDPKLKGH